jgi:hypothetical protein
MNIKIQLFSQPLFLEGEKGTLFEIDFSTEDYTPFFLKDKRLSFNCSGVYGEPSSFMLFSVKNNVLSVVS